MTKMTNACRLLAEHIQRVELDEDLYGELKFLRHEMVEILMEEGNQIEFQSEFLSQQDEEVQNPWLLELTKRLFN